MSHLGVNEPEFLDVAPPDPRYASVLRVLDAVRDQVVSGKGAERHGTSERFEDQPTGVLIRSLGLGGPAFQALKKAVEAERLNDLRGMAAARAELLGSMAYQAFCVAEIDRRIASGE